MCEEYNIFYLEFLLDLHQSSRSFTGEKIAKAHVEVLERE
jgi:hypothetical protein